MAEKIPADSERQTLSRLDDARLQQIVTGYSTAFERGDVDALVALLTEDVTWAMPPLPHWYQGLAAVTDFAARVPMSTCGAWRHLPTSANGQPAVASYLWNASAGAYACWSIDVLTLRGDRIAPLTAFIGSEHFVQFGLPLSLT